jgi:hypothetical protein
MLGKAIGNGRAGDNCDKDFNEPVTQFLMMWGEELYASG